MDSSAVEYKRVRGPVNDFLLVGSEHHSLWMAEDHLLYVQRDGYDETYKRFYFRDIRALTIQKTRRHVFLEAVLGIILFCPAALLLVALHDGWWVGAKIIWGVVAAVVAFMLALNRWRGATCECCVETAVQRQVLYPLGRLRVAERVVLVLRERIEAVQGRLPPGFLETWVAAPAPVVEAVPAAVAPLASRAIRHCTGKAHLVFFSFLLVDFGLTIPGFYMEADRLPDSVSIGAFLGLVVSVVVSLVSQERSDLWASIRRLAWAGMVYMAGTLVAGVVATIALSIRHGVSSPDQMKNYLMPLGSTEGFVIGVVSLLATGFIGGIGLWRTLQYRRQAKPQKGPPVPPPLPPPARDASGDALPSPDEVSA